MLDRVDQTPAAAELHRARPDEIHPRLIDRAVALLDDQAVLSAPPEIARQRQSHRPRAHDQNRNRLATRTHRLSASSDETWFDLRGSVKLILLRAREEHDAENA